MILKAAAQNLPLRDNCVQCVVTSPPYWGLRKYAGQQELMWGGAVGCGHEWTDERKSSQRIRNGEAGGIHEGRATNTLTETTLLNPVTGSTCQLCGAWRGGFELENAFSKASTATNIGQKRSVGDPSGRNLRNVWTFATQPYKGAHFATFPAELVIRCLQAATKVGDLVLDPFAGSGTVGEVAFNMGRRFILSDLAYQDLQRDRIPPMAFAFT